MGTDNKGEAAMIKRMVYVLLVVGLLLSVAAVASAGGGCADGFELHPTMDHDGDHEHPLHHIGTDTDLNGDGQICVKHLSDTIHVRIDNNAAG
jgi:hypothetical protein